MATSKSLLFGLLISIASFVNAAPAERPCQADIQRVCQDAIGDRQAVRQCVRNNFANLSEQCQARLMQARQQGGQGAGRAQNRPAEADKSTEKESD